MLPPDAALEFNAATFVYLNPLSLLAERFNIDGDQLLDVTVKCHMLAHTAMRASDLNPRRAWCYSGERFMLVMWRTVQATVRGTKPIGVGSKVVLKYRYALNDYLKT